MMPSLFISHGSPTTMIEKESAARQFMLELGPKLPKPEAIVVVSAHWETPRTMVNAPTENETIHDFFGFPRQMYEITYPAPSAPGLAQKISDLTGAPLDTERGLDHGAWSPLYLIFPQANIPVLQVSVQRGLDAQYHYELGEKLAPLRKEGVMIIGSGSATHNLGELMRFDRGEARWAAEFENWLVDAVERNDHGEILAAEQKAPHYHRAHPRAEHWVPIYVPMGAAKEKATLLHRGMEHHSLSMVATRYD